MIVSANQNPFPPDYRYQVSGGFDPGYRSRQIANLLSTRKGWRAEDMLSVQKDVYSAFTHFLARQVVAAYAARGRGNKNLSEPAEILRGWNGQMEKDLAAPMIASLIYQHLRRRVVERAAPGKALAYRSAMAPAAIERLLRERPKDWFNDYDELLLKAFDDAMEEGRRLQGDKSAKCPTDDTTGCDRTSGGRPAADRQQVLQHWSSGQQRRQHDGEGRRQHFRSFHAHGRGRGRLGAFAAQPAHGRVRSCALIAL